MTSTDATLQAHPTARQHRTLLRVVSAAFVAAIVALSVAALSADDPGAATTETGRPASPVVAPMTPDAAEHWLVDEGRDDVPMTPDAAEHWLVDG
jgi:hypothetical protein